MLSNMLLLTEGVIGLIVGIVVVVLAFLILFASRYRKCPSDKIMVIYGRIGNNADGTMRSAKCVHGGASFVIPFFQAYQYMDLTPMSISVDLKSALSRQNIRIDVPSTFTVGISTEQGVMQNAAERLLGLRLNEVQELAKDIIFGQLRLIIATMEIEEINTDRDKFLDAVSSNVETELKKIGLRLINVNITDINDASGYIEALGREAAAKALNDAKKSVAEKNRDGSIGEANALMQQRIQVADSNRLAIAGENEALAKMSTSNAERREVEAESLRRATSAEKIATAKALEEAYEAEMNAELARATREKATLEADTIIKAEIQKRELEIQAEAKAEQTRRTARGEADAIYSKMEAEARGIEAMLTKQAQGFKNIVEAAGGDANDAVKLMISDKIEELVKTQVEAIKNIKIDKITVWDSMNGEGGSSTTSGFMSSLFKAVPPLNEMFDLAGMKLPDYLGKKADAKSTDIESVKTTKPN
ncbi:MAG: SPFH domain-containing protein [Clostridia bacterium]